MSDDCIFVNDWKKVRTNTLKRNDSAVAFLYGLEIFNNLKIGENKMKTILFKNQDGQGRLICYAKELDAVKMVLLRYGYWDLVIV